MRGPYRKMAGSRSDHLASSSRRDLTVKVVLSYVFDWVVLIVAAGIGAVLDRIEPNKRPFSLNDPNISFPYAEHETVPTWLLVIIIGAAPAAIIAVVCLIFVPGATVPKNTPASLVWKRKLWELHVGWLGLLLSVASAFFFTSGMKNLYGKPRPDLLDRCNPDIDNAAKYVVGGFAGENPLGRLYSAAICTETDSHKLDDGFRSYPSGHASTSAAGLVYLSLFLATKFAVNIPFVAPQAGHSSAASSAAFPSRLQQHSSSVTENSWDDDSSPVNTKYAQASHNAKISSLRRQAAAPPVYLLAIVLAPFCGSIFIASSRWFDFRHHGFDILFGYLMGLITAVYSFRYYHLPLQAGAGWAWGPRSDDRAFWAGVGRLGYADNVKDEEAAVPLTDGGRIGMTNDVEIPSHHASAPGSSHMMQRPANTAYAADGYGHPHYEDVEMGRMDNRI